jgi:hypothetical protein
MTQPFGDRFALVRVAIGGKNWIYYALVCDGAIAVHFCCFFRGFKSLIPVRAALVSNSHGCHFSIQPS